MKPAVIIDALRETYGIEQHPKFEATKYFKFKVNYCGSYWPPDNVLLLF